MKLRSFLKEKIAYMIVLVIISITCEILLLAYDISPIVRVYIAITPLLGYIIVLLIEYHKKAKYYQSLKEQAEEYDYYINEIDRLTEELNEKDNQIYDLEEQLQDLQDRLDNIYSAIE